MNSEYDKLVLKKYIVRLSDLPTHIMLKLQYSTVAYLNEILKEYHCVCYLSSFSLIHTLEFEGKIYYDWFIGK